MDVRIDRDWEQILIYTQKVNQRINEIEGKMRVSIEYLDSFTPSINDKNCYALFKDLALNCSHFTSCLEKLRTENDDIETEAKKLELVVAEGMGGYRR